MRRLIRSLSALVLLLALAACEPMTAPTSTATDVLPPPDPIGPTTTSHPVTSTTQPAPTGSSEYYGVLPDGTEYRVSIEGVVGETIEFIDAPIVLDDDRGQAIGIASFPAGDTESSYSFENGLYRIPAGGAARIEFYDDVLSELGPDAEEIIRGSITGTTQFDLFPVLELKPPFRWAEDFELPAAMEVRYHSFTVRRGCGNLAAACSETRAVQVIPIDNQTVPIEAWEDLEVYIESPAARPTAHPNYLDPGPLDPRLSADLIWTGEEMIVWGGKQARDGLNTLVDGAAFNPETSEWRMIATFPLQGPQANRAVWGDGEMVVVSRNGTFGYDPESDSWRMIGNGVGPSEWNDRMLYLDGWIYIWDRAFSMHRMDVRVGMWETIEAPDEIAGFTEGRAGVLRVLDQELIAVTVHDGCQGRQLWRLSSDGWVALPEASLATEIYSDCSAANQTAPAGDELVIWNAEHHPSAVYSFETDTWHEVAPIPLGGVEGPSGPVPMGTDHFLVPRWGEAAIFEGATEEWTRVILPGQGTDAEMIWTGEEILAWGIFETFDAWRWAPLQIAIGGDDAS